MKLCSASIVNVVVPQNATTREQFAAEELCKYLKKVFCGITAGIATDDAPLHGDKILVGGPERNRITAQHISEAELMPWFPALRE